MEKVSLKKLKLLYIGISLGMLIFLLFVIYKWKIKVSWILKNYYERLKGLLWFL